VTIIAQPGTVTQNSGQIGGTPSLAFDIADRSLYLTDSYGDVVKRILPNGHAVVVAGHCIGGYNGYGCTPGSIEGKGTNALFGSPGGLVYDARRDVLVMADFTNNQLWELHADGQALVAAGYGPSADYDGNAWRAFFGGPNALVYSKDQGEIFVSDYGRLSAYAVTGPHAPTVAQPTVRFPFSNPNAQMGFPTVSSGNAWFVVDGSIVNIAPTGQRHYYKPPARPSAFGQIAIDRQGNLWLLVQNGILSMSPDGKFRRFNLRKGTIANLNSPIIGPDGNPWFADQDFTAPAIATVVNGKIVTYSLGSGLSAPRPGWLITGPDGSVWYTTGQDEIDRISTSGKPLSPIRLKKVSPSQMVYNKKSGDVWFLDSYADNTAYRMTPDHAVHTFSLKCGCAAGSSNITVTPNDTAFVAENNGGAIAGVTPDGRLMGYYMPSQSSGVYGIAAATDTSLWITTLAGQVFLFDPAQYVKSGLPPNPLVGSGSY
jgi:streptogramin lyase